MQNAKPASLALGAKSEFAIVCEELDSALLKDLL
jgi:hypothetical protein